MFVPRYYRKLVKPVKFNTNAELRVNSVKFVTKYNKTWFTRFYNNLE